MDVRVAYDRLDDVDEILRYVRELSPRTVLFDVEPLVAYWDTDAAALATGVEDLLGRLGTATGIQAIGFTTNSARRHRIEGGRGEDGPHVFYLASARKPLRIAPYQDLPRPGIVVGDQIATDGALAWRLGYAFLHYTPRYVAPLGPRMMRLVGLPLRRLLFTAPTSNRTATRTRSRGRWTGPVSCCKPEA